MNAPLPLRTLAAWGLVAAFALLPSAGYCDSVGAAAAVKPSSTGTPPGGSARTLEIGTGIVANERINTTDTGSLQVMFLDKSTLTVGPNSDLVIDQFVYNSNAGTGQFAANLTKGALRFVGGQISHGGGATIDTPAATIGIRGGAAIIIHGPCEANKSSKGGSSSSLQDAKGECTKLACTGGTCTYKAKFGSAEEVQVRLNEVANIGMTLSNEPPVDAETVNLNRVATGGTVIEEGESNNSHSQTPASIDALSEEFAIQQQHEPPPPPAN